jgi:FKBP-type peptidyl-prolyl cis-trans isomerase
MRAVLVAALLSLAACQKEPEPPSTAEARAFLAENRGKPGVVTTKSGLQYKVVRAGPKDRPTAREGDEVKVHYEGRLPGGPVFESTYEQGAPAVFTVGRLVEGWNEALQLMRPGDEFILWVPPELGYGEEGAGPIPPNSVLEFRMEMVDVLPRGGGTAFG